MLRIDPLARQWLEVEARLQLPAERDLEAGLYSADDFLRYDLTNGLLDYLADAFDVLEVIGLNRRRLRVDQGVTVESFDIIAKVDENDPLMVVPVALSIWQREPNLPAK